MKIAAVIISFNEARNIGRCIDSVKAVADEIVVVDSFSNDDTAAICREKGARVIQKIFEGHVEQKNFAISQAQFDYILSLDADEALSETLKQSILHLKNAGCPAPAYSMNRLTNYCGQWIRHGGWYPDRKIRLWDRRFGKWGGLNPHDKVILENNIKPVFLQGDILHYTVNSVSEHMAQAKKYAFIGAESAFRAGKKSNWLLILGGPVFKFFRDYLLKLGFLDGLNGWRIAIISARAKYWKYRRLYQLQNASYPQ
jgi:glycosyltransferase involved in cell wall biosynthesis